MYSVKQVSNGFVTFFVDYSRDLGSEVVERKLPGSVSKYLKETFKEESQRLLR